MKAQFTFKVEKALHKSAQYVPIDSDQMLAQIRESMDSLMSLLANALSAFLAQIPNMALSFSMFLFSLYFFLTDGPSLVRLH